MSLKIPSSLNGTMGMAQSVMCSPGVRFAFNCLLDTIWNRLGRVAVRDCPDQGVLWVCLWELIVLMEVSAHPLWAALLSGHSVILWAWDPRLYGQERRQQGEHQHACVHGLTALCSCHCV